MSVLAEMTDTFTACLASKKMFIATESTANVTLATWRVPTRGNYSADEKVVVSHSVGLARTQRLFLEWLGYNGAMNADMTSPPNHVSNS